MNHLDKNVEYLRELCADKDWLYDVSIDQFGRYVVYANYMNGDVLRFVPDKTPDGKEVLCHFAAHVKANKADFLNGAPQHLIPVYKLPPDIVAPVLNADELEDLALEQSVQEMTDELDALKWICGIDALQEIFYEIKDMDNAITNTSEKYPEVRERMQTLYDKYGFDILVEEFDG